MRFSGVVPRLSHCAPLGAGRELPQRGFDQLNADFNNLPEKGRFAQIVAQTANSPTARRNDFTDSDESADPATVGEPILKAVSGVSENI